MEKLQTSISVSEHDSAETESDHILRKQEMLIVFVTQVCSKEQREDLVGNEHNSD